MKRRILYNFLLFLILQSCEEAFLWENTKEPASLLVVEGMITNERKAHTVKLSKTVANLNEESPVVSGALVVISDGDRKYVLKEEGRTGIYKSDVFQGVFGKPYFLYIRFSGKEYTAKTHMVPVTPFKEVKYEVAPSDPSLYQYVFQESVEPAMEEVLLDWAQPAGDTLAEDRIRARLLFYTLRTIDVNQIFAPEKEKVFFPPGTTIVRKKYSLSDEQQEFIRSLMFETDWRGGVFDVEKGNVKTNLSEGAVGYFAASTVISDTTVVRL